MFYCNKKQTISIKQASKSGRVNSPRKSPGFTLIELLLVVGVLAILMAVIVIIINPAELMKQSRDAVRISDTETIVKALQVYQGSGAGESTMGSSNTIYISVPALNSNCSDLNLPALLSGWSYACSTSANYTKTDGTGWIPVNFISLAYGSPFDRLPIDPINATSTGLYYTYIKGSIAVSAGLESDKYLATIAITDSGYSYARFEMGNDLSRNAYIPNCGGVPVVYGGKSYNTVQISKQCWFAQNINVGTLTAGTNTQGTSCSSIQKYCYSNSEANCTSDGGLYQWDQAMCGSTSAGARGICPSGWHIPTHDEFTTLERAVCTSGTCATDFPYDLSTIDWRGTNEGTALKSGGASGFNGILAGIRLYNGSFDFRTSYANIWLSVASVGNAWVRYLSSSNTTVYRGTDGKEFGFSIRCLKD